jgi:hypothetical protein
VKGAVARRQEVDARGEVREQSCSVMRWLAILGICPREQVARQPMREQHVQAACRAQHIVWRTVNGVLVLMWLLDAPQIIELAAGGVPWKEHLYELEKQEGIEGAIKFCLYEVLPAPDQQLDLYPGLS